MDNWIYLTAEMNEDGTIEVSRDAHYEWDDKGNEALVYEHADVEFTAYDIYALMMNMHDTGELFDDGLDYGEYSFIAWGHSAAGDNEHGYIVNQYDAQTLNDENVIELYPLTGDWEPDVRAAFDRMLGEVRR